MPGFKKLESFGNIFQALVEFLSPVLLFLSWAVLMKVAMRRFRLLRGLDYKNNTIAFYTLSGSGLIGYFLCLFLMIEPLVTLLFNAELLDFYLSTILFWTLASVIFIGFPFLTTRLLAGFFMTKTEIK